jgi:mannose-1-phosphate guanylyltransferase
MSLITKTPAALQIRERSGRQSLRESVWAIVLAGGEGTRVRSFLARLCGGSGIKQFSAVIGRRSMLQHTVSRVVKLIDRRHILASLNAAYRSEAMYNLPQLPLENLIFQPRNIDTAPGILLPLAHITHRDPNAMVAVFPSDHFIQNEDKFTECVENAIKESRNHSDVLMLLGATPDGPDESYGWIEPAPGVSGSVARDVLSFREKPMPKEAFRLMSRGCLCNMFVFVGRAEMLWNIVSNIAPELYRAFWTIRLALKSIYVRNLIERTYETLGPLNFSSEILTRARSQLRVLQVPRIGWSDWGTKERILASLKEIGRYEEFSRRFNFTQLKTTNQDDPLIRPPEQLNFSNTRQRK